MSATHEMHAAEPGETGTACEAAEVVQDVVAFPVQPDPASVASTHSARRPAALTGSGERHPSPVRDTGMSQVDVRRLLPVKLRAAAGEPRSFSERAA